MVNSIPSSLAYQDCIQAALFCPPAITIYDNGYMLGRINILCHSSINFIGSEAELAGE